MYRVHYRCMVSCTKDSLSPANVCLTGTAKIINRKTDGRHGTMYKIVPMTTNNVSNQITCFRVPGHSESPVVPQGVVPNASLYKVQRV